MNFIFATKYNTMTLEIKDYEVITWYVDAAFAVHGEKKSHTGLL